MAPVLISCYSIGRVVLVVQMPDSVIASVEAIRVLLVRQLRPRSMAGGLLTFMKPLGGEK